LQFWEVISDEHGIDPTGEFDQWLHARKYTRLQ
jgi:hypothetical protein